MKAALSAMRAKTDRNDARGIAQLIRMGWFRPVHAKAKPAQEVRLLLTARRQVQTKLLDLEGGIRSLLRGFGLKVGPIGTPASNRRWASDGFEIPCWNGEAVHVAFRAA